MLNNISFILFFKTQNQFQKKLFCIIYFLYIFVAINTELCLINK